MKMKFMIAGALITILLMATLGTVIALDDSEFETNGAATTETIEDEDAQYLITEAQLEEIREASEEMIHAQMMENLESYNLTDEQIMEIEELLLAIDELRDEIKAQREEMMDSDLSWSEKREAMEPLMIEIQTLRTELKELLDSYGIIMPKPMHRAPRFGGPGFGGPEMGPGHGGPGMGDGNGMRHGGMGDGSGMPGGPKFGGPRP